MVSKWSSKFLSMLIIVYNALAPEYHVTIVDLIYSSTKSTTKFKQAKVKPKAILK